MANTYCQACEDLREEVPELIANGFDNSMCASLQNDTGLKASSGNNDCTDLNNLNDCLIGNADEELEDYDVCDWKEFMRMLLPNLWTTLKAIICAICGIWTNIHNLWKTLRSLCITKTGNTIKLVSDLGTHCSVTDSDTKYDLSKSGRKIILTGSDGSTDEVDIPDTDTWKPNTRTQEGYVAAGDGHADQVWATNSNGVPAWRDKGSIDGRAFVRFYRDLGTGSESVPYWDNISDGFERTLNIYMNPSGMDGGNQAADRDYVVIVSNCTNLRYFGDINAQVTVYSSGDTRSIATLRSHLGQHPSVAIKQNGTSGVIRSDTFFENFSWTTSSAVLIKKGEHIKVNFHVSDAKAGSSNNSVAPSARMHQFVCTWIPVAVEIN